MNWKGRDRTSLLHRWIENWFIRYIGIFRVSQDHFSLHSYDHEAELLSFECHNRSFPLVQ